MDVYSGLLTLPGPVWGNVSLPARTSIVILTQKPENPVCEQSTAALLTISEKSIQPAHTTPSSQVRELTSCILGPDSEALRAKVWHAEKQISGSLGLWITSSVTTLMGSGMPGTCQAPGFSSLGLTLVHHSARQVRLWMAAFEQPVTSHSVRSIR